MDLTITSDNGQSIPIFINIDCKTHHICKKEKKRLVYNSMSL